MQAVPSYVSFFRRFLASQVERKRHYSCGVQTFPASAAPRVDAQASADTTGKGGWLPAVRPDGSLDLWRSHWFSLELTRESWPWIFEKSDGPSVASLSTLEALSVLFSLMLFFEEAALGPTRVQVAPTWTDNRCNGSALNKLMTSRFPASAVLMEMSVLMKTKGLQASVQWAPGAANREADWLANGDTQDFNLEYECAIDPAAVRWHILPQALEEGRRAERAYQEFRTSGRDPQRGKKQRRRRPEEKRWEKRVAPSWSWLSLCVIPPLVLFFPVPLTLYALAHTVACSLSPVSRYCPAVAS